MRPGQPFQTIGIISRPRRSNLAVVVPPLLKWLEARGIQTLLDEETANCLPNGSKGETRERVADGHATSHHAEHHQVVLRVAHRDGVAQRETQLVEGGGEAGLLVDAGGQDHHRALVEDDLVLEAQLAHHLDRVDLVRLAGGDARAELLSSRPITIAVPFTPGASADTIQRIVTRKVTEDTGQVIVVESRPGGGGADMSGGVIEIVPGSRAPLHWHRRGELQFVLV